MSEAIPPLLKLRVITSYKMLVDEEVLDRLDSIIIRERE